MAYKLDLRKSVANLVGELSTQEILRVFQDKPISRATIFRVIKDCREGKLPENKKKSGRPPKLNDRATKSLLSSAKNKVGQSTRQLSRKFGVNQSTVVRILRKNSAFFHKSKYSAKQLEIIPKCCRALRDKHFSNGKFIILDNESYFTFSQDGLSGNYGYYTDNIEATPDNVKFADKAEFEPIVLVWCAFSSKGISEPVILSQKAKAINSDIYIDQCLPKLKQFVENKHARDEIMFWPDLASYHYAKKTTDWLTGQNIPFVPKKDNPPNIPQARRIKDFWSDLKCKVYEKGWEAKTEQQLIERIKRKLKEVDISVCQNMISKVPKILRKIEDNGPFSVL